MWTLNIQDGDAEILDHTDSVVATIANDGAGFSKPQVKEVMMEEAIAEYQRNGFNNRVFAILRDAIFEQIEKVE